ncbi:hypothetical protein RZS08_09910, partial [Arthrospira platensis SPKY1]|nr:hypothetical protein [Arthrospira platensis SPKY1]
GLSYIDASRAVADTVIQVLGAANALVVEVGEGLDQIAQASAEQRMASQSVTVSIGEIAGMAQENNCSVDRTVAAAQTLEQLAARLQESVSRFRF